MHRASLAVLCTLFGSSACISVKPVVVDRTSQLENQVLGRLQRLEAELILASSVRGDAQPAPRSPWQREAAEAVMRRAFNEDDIAVLKRSGRVGEAIGGELRVLDLPTDRAQARWVRQLVAEENHDRGVIMQRVLQLSPDLTSDDLPLIRAIFHRLAMRAAQPGDRLQRDDGRWITVPGHDEAGS